jgi:hypothetical protein
MTYLRTKEAAERLRVSPSFLEKRRVYGDGPPYTTAGKIVLYAVEELDRWLAERTRCSTSERGLRAGRSMTAS